MSARMELAYLLIAGTTLLAVVVTGIWWTQRRRNQRLGTASSPDPSSSSRSRTPAEELRAARLRRLAQINSMAANSEPAKERANEKDRAEAERKPPTATQSFTAVESPADEALPTGSDHGGDDDSQETSHSSEDVKPDEKVAKLPPEKKAKDDESISAASSPPKPAQQSTVAALPVKIPVPSTDSVFVVNRQVQSKPLSGSVMGTIDENGCPVSKPLKTLEELFQWFPGNDRMCVPTVPLRPRAKQDSKKPRTIVCHDMMGGYQVDRFVQGAQTVEDYHYYHWHLIDAFIYFSHNLVTIPPPSWTNAAHQHGVLSLGTFITEWEDGAKMCAQIFYSENAVSLAVDKMVMLAEYYQLDGWLINIENPVAPQYIVNVEVFLRQLTDNLHMRRPGSLVIWYDSITRNGQLRWQNALNEQNMSFFAACDGIFLNYNWTTRHLLQSRQAAGERQHDVFVGVDVFGRGCPGGGGFNSSEAMSMIRNEELSAAIFAPGWVFETQDKTKFIDNQNRFWQLLESTCYPKGVAGIPLVTSFGRGYGTMLAIDGEVVMRQNWTNHSAMDLQPSFISDVLQIGGKAAPTVYPVYVNLSECYNQGGSLCVSGSVPPEAVGRGARSMVRLFYTEISMKIPLLVAYTFKLDQPTPVDHFLQFCNDKLPRYVLLKGESEVEDRLGEELDDNDNVLLSRYGIPRSRPCELPASMSTDTRNYCGFRPLPVEYACMLHEAFTGHTQFKKNGWITNYYLVTSKDLTGCTAQEVRLVCASPRAAPAGSPSAFTIHLGEIKVLNPQCLCPKESSGEGRGRKNEVESLSHISNLVCSEAHWTPLVSASSGNTSGVLTAVLSWMNHHYTVDPIHHCNVYRAKGMEGEFTSTGAGGGTPSAGTVEFIGRAHCDQFVVPPFTVQGEQQIKFYLQPVTVARRLLPWQQCPSVTILLDAITK